MSLLLTCVRHKISQLLPSFLQRKDVGNTYALSSWVSPLQVSTRHCTQKLYQKLGKSVSFTYSDHTLAVPSFSLRTPRHLPHTAALSPAHCQLPHFQSNVSFSSYKTPIILPPTYGCQVSYLLWVHKAVTLHFGSLAPITPSVCRDFGPCRPVS